MAVFLLILGLVLFISLVVIHEFGHFIVARRNGVKVEEFGIFFPPRLWFKKMKSGFVFSLNAIPLGGFVRLKGEHDADNEPGGFGVANLWVKTKILLAGVTMNLLAAIFLFMILAWVGMPQLVNNQFTVASDTKVTTDKVLISQVLPNSPAQAIGLKQNDQLLGIGKIGGPIQKVNSSNNLPNITKQYAGQKVEVKYKRGSTTYVKDTTLLSSSVVNSYNAQHKNSNNQKGYLGVAPLDYSLQKSTWSAPIVAVGLVKQIAVLTYQGLWSIVRGIAHGSASQATSQVAGPVGIFFLLKNGSTLGYQFILVIIAVISLTLAIMNALPIPALDGGRLFVILVSNLFGKRLKQRTEELISGTGFAILLVLIVLITIVDIKRH